MNGVQATIRFRGIQKARDFQRVDSQPTWRRGFAFADMAGVLAVLAVVLFAGAIMLPTLGSRCGRTAPEMISNTQARMVQSALVLYAAGNNSYYAGLDSTGREADLNGGIANGYEVEARFEALLQGGYFTSDYVVSPAEAKTPWTTGELDTSQYSFALLVINGEHERTEWRDTINTEAVVVSDRAATGTDQSDITSVWSDTPGDWRGTLAWNDNHVTFKRSHRNYKTKYGDHVNLNSDDLFADESAGTGDAFMAFYRDRGVWP